MMNLVPWPYRLLVLAVFAVALGGFCWVKGANHVQDKWDREQQAQAVKIVRIETRQKAATETINHEASSLVDRSDAYYRGLRLNPHPVPGLPGSTASSDATASAASPGATGDSAGSGGTNGTPNYSKNYSCDPADGAADAIVILEWQRWTREMRAAEREH